MTSEDIKQLRKQLAQRKRRIVFHSDGMAMDPKKRFLEPGVCILPYLPGTQTDACTYSLIHQFPVVRLYRSKAGQEWPPGIIEKMYGDGPDGLEEYIAFCRKNGYEAFWIMRTNDTHDAGGGSHGQRRWNSNKWKQAHQKLLVGRKDHRPPHAGWTAFDYAQPEVREKVFRILEEVCLNYEIDGLQLDFFRHLPTFKSTAWGGEASAEERAMLTSLFRRTRKMMDEIGARRGRPILMAVRTPDSPGYCKALGLDVERWMKEDLIDIWIVTGYFRLQEWKETVRVGHKYGVQVWASLDESRIPGRAGCNSVEQFRARAMNAWRAGVDSLWIFNFFYTPNKPQFKVLYELGDPAKLADLDKLYVPDARGRRGASRYLRNGDRFFTRPPIFSPINPRRLENGKPQTVDLLVGDDLGSAMAKGLTPQVTLGIEAEGLTNHEDLSVRFNNKALNNGVLTGGWLKYTLKPATVKLGSNRIEIALSNENNTKPVLRDLQLSIKY